jgi:hypothetical protein
MFAHYILLDSIDVFAQLAHIGHQEMFYWQVFESSENYQSKFTVMQTLIES